MAQAQAAASAACALGERAASLLEAHPLAVARAHAARRRKEGVFAADATSLTALQRRVSRAGVGGREGVGFLLLAF